MSYSIPYFYYYWKGLRKMPELKNFHIPDSEELDVIFQRLIDSFEQGKLTVEEFNNLKIYCVNGFRLKNEIAVEHHCTISKFRDQIEAILSNFKPDKKNTPLKQKIRNLVKETWD